MGAIIGSLGSSVGGLLLMLVVAAGLVSIGAIEMHKIDEAKYEKLELSYKTAEAKAVAEAAAEQKANDDAALAAASKEAQVQQQATAAVQQELASVKNHVSVTVVPCIPFGLVRVLDAAVFGVAPESLNLPPGKSDNSCSTVTVNQLAGAIVKNYGNARANAEQLNAVISLLRQQGVVMK
jgi:hypothetical protein